MQKKESYQSILRVAREALLLEFLYESFPDRSRKSIKSLLEQKQIMILNQIVTRFDYQLAPGMDVIILKKKPSQNMTLRNLNLLYEDEHLLVIEKSAGLLSVATEKEIHGYEPQSKLRGIRPSAMRDCSTYQFRYAYSDL